MANFLEMSGDIQAKGIEVPREIARKPRFIYPQVATSLTLAKISALGELLFWRILPQADDQGRLPGDPKLIKAIACPLRQELTEDNISQLLSELESAELIIRYSNSSNQYIQITKWWDYQSSMRRIFPSQYPPPEGWKDIIKGVVPQTPTNADKRPIEEEEEEESGKGKGIVEEEVGTATSTTETAMKPSTEETHEDSKGVTETASETALLRFLETLEGWRFRRAEDLAWLREFLAEYSEFSLSFAKACRDYHSGRVKAKHKGIWKNRFREWMEHDRQFKKERSQANGVDKKHSEPAEKWDPSRPLRPATGSLGDWTPDKPLR